MRGLEKILIGPLGLVIFVALYPLYHSFPWLRVLVLPLACWTMSIALVLLRWLLRSDSSAMTDTAWGLAAVGAGFLYFGLAWKIWHSIGVLVLALLLFVVIGAIVMAGVIAVKDRPAVRSQRRPKSQ